MIRILIFLFMGFVCSASIQNRAANETLQDAASQNETKLFWIFLTTGKPTEGVERSEIQKMQAAHLANFDRLHKAGKLLAAGPMGDPDRILRGIVVIKAKDRVDLMSMFDPDPYVKQGFMNVEACPMKIELGGFNAETEGEEMEELRIVVASDAENANRSIDSRLNAYVDNIMQKYDKNSDGALDNDELKHVRIRLKDQNGDGEISHAEALAHVGGRSQSNSDTYEGNRKYYQKLFEDKQLRMAIRLNDDSSKRRTVLVFAKLEDGQLDELISEIPANQKKLRSYKSMPLYSGKGIIK